MGILDASQRPEYFGAFRLVHSVSLVIFLAIVRDILIPRAFAGLLQMKVMNKCEVFHSRFIYKQNLELPAFKLVD